MLLLLCIFPREAKKIVITLLMCFKKKIKIDYKKRSGDYTQNI